MRWIAVGVLLEALAVAVVDHEMTAREEIHRRLAADKALAAAVAADAAKEADEARISALLNIKMKTGYAVFIQNFPGDK